MRRTLSCRMVLIREVRLGVVGAGNLPGLLRRRQPRSADWAATEGYGLVGGIGEYEGTWRMAYVRGPEGIIVSLAERIG